MKRVFKRIIGNINIILGLVFLVFVVLDWYNAYMNFVGNSLSVKLLIVFCIISIINGVLVQIEQVKK